MEAIDLELWEKKRKANGTDATWERKKGYRCHVLFQVAWKLHAEYYYQLTHSDLVADLSWLVVVCSVFFIFNHSGFKFCKLFVNDRMKGGEKWHGCVTKIMTSPCERIWKLSADFINVNRYAKNIHRCDHVEGEKNEIGCVRYCSGSDERMLWAKEKLLTMDTVNRCYSYSVVDGNLGIEGYVANFKVYNTTNGNCVVEWSFQADPSKYYEEEEFIRFLTGKIEQMIEGLDETAASEEST